MHAVMFFFLFKEFYNQAYNRKGGKVVANGHIKQNGNADHVKENGTTSYAKENGYSTPTKNGASKYYMNGTSELNNRIKSQWYWFYVR